MREGLGKGWMNEGGGCRVVTFSSGHVKARLWLHRAVSPRLENRLDFSIWEQNISV